jgi:hypothetical protein
MLVRFGSKRYGIASGITYLRYYPSSTGVDNTQVEIINVLDRLIVTAIWYGY